MRRIFLILMIFIFIIPCYAEQWKYFYYDLDSYNIESIVDNNGTIAVWVKTYDKKYWSKERKNIFYGKRLINISCPKKIWSQSIFITFDNMDRQVDSFEFNDVQIKWFAIIDHVSISERTTQEFLYEEICRK